MAAVRLLRPGNGTARTAALQTLRLVRHESLRAAPRPHPPQAHRPWGAAAVSVALHAALVVALLWQAPGGESATGTTVEVVFRAADASAESRSGDAQAEIEEAPTLLAAAALPVASPVPTPAANVVEPPSPVETAAPVEPDPSPEFVALAAVEAPPDASRPPDPVAQAAVAAPPDAPLPPDPVLQAAAETALEVSPPPKPVQQVAADVPPAAQTLPPPPPSRPAARRQPIESRPEAAPAVAAVKPAHPVSLSTSAPAAQAAPAATAAAPAPQPQGEIPVIREARFREPPTPARYPSRAIDLSQQGTVIVRALVAPDGKADEIVVWRSSGYALLDAAALRAVRGWSFEPASVGSRRITAWVEVPVRFAIR
jgi:protein TonB